MWIPNVLSEAVLCAAYDTAFTSREEAAVANVERNLRLFRSPMYRALMIVASPRLLLRGTGSRWLAFHRGSTMSLVGGDDQQATLMLSFPPHLFVPENPLDVRGAVEAAFISAGSRHARVIVDAHTETSITYIATF